ncbi:MAG TPA: S8 family serine peptidase [Micromonosporaceae bacterium]|nr:S8 family serine peptidase [Micromonosporaceae bacterium]
MRRLHRVILAATIGIVTAVATAAVGSVGAQGRDNLRTLTLDGESEQVRLNNTDQSFQISPDGGRSWSRSMPQARQIHLRSGSVDPLQTVRAAGDGGAHIVQFFAAPLDSQRRDLRRLGVRLGAYLPDFAYVARMDAASAKAVASRPYVRWVGGYLASDKIAPEVTAGRVRIALVNRDLVDQGGLINRIEALGGTVHLASASRAVVEATVDGAQLRAIAGDAAVLAIDAWAAPAPDMNNAREDGGANLIEAARGYRGQGVRAEVMDGGLRTTHQEFAARPPILHGPNTTDTSHGTSTYGQIFAQGVSAQHRGMLPEAQGIIAAYTQVSDRYAHTAQLVNPSGAYRAVFQSNSWGDGLTTSYTTISADMDDIVFDHDILICQSQSNAGTRSSRPQAWAKNLVSVGGQFHFNTLSRTDDRWNGGASIGPAADGRIKPDLSNYYDQINTTSSTSNTSYTSSFGGTSGATPITCGNFGLLFQMWADGVFAGGPGLGRDVFGSRPHAATAKAMMINQANQYSFSGTAADLTRVHQGWGTASVGNLYNQAQANGWRLPVLVNETDLLTVGQRRTYTVATDGTQPLKATLVWTDPAGSPSASKAQVNDLTLRVIAPGGTVYWGNNGLAAGNWSTAGGVANTVDTVENVFVQNPAAGTWTIEVSADAVNSDGHVETPATDVDYALVVTAKAGTPPTTVYSDTFETATGWTTNPNGTDTATTGQWERGDPEATTSSGPKQLGTTVSGVNDLVTGRLAGASAGEFDIDAGTTSIRSPAITLPPGGTLNLSMSWYLAHGSNSSSADFFSISIVHSGGTTSVFTQAGAATNRDGSWVAGSWNISAFAGQSIQILVQAADASGASLVEAGVDDVRITRQT